MPLDLSTSALLVFFLGVGIYLHRVLGINLSASSALLGVLLLLHGPAYVYYTRVWGPDSGFFLQILSATPRTDVIENLDLALVLTFTFVIAGFVFVDTIVGKTPLAIRKSIQRWNQSELTLTPGSGRRLHFIMLAMIVALLIPFMLIDNQIPKIKEYFTAGATALEKVEIRRESGGSSFYLYNLLVASALPFLAFSAVALLNYRRSRHKLVAWVFIGLVALAKMATLSKASVAIFILQLVLVRRMTRSLQLSVPALLLIAVLMTALFSVMSLVALPDLESSFAVLDYLFYRIFMIVNEGLVEYFAAIPYVIPHNWGTQSGLVAAILNVPQAEPTYWIVGEVHRGELGSTTTVMFLGNAWADFAWAGVVLEAFICGVIIRSIDIALLVRRRKTIGTVAGLGLAHFGIFVAMTSSSLQTALLTGGLLLVIPLVILVDSRYGRLHPRGDILPAASSRPANPQPRGDSA